MGTRDNLGVVVLDFPHKRYTSPPTKRHQICKFVLFVRLLRVHRRHGACGWPFGGHMRPRLHKPGILLWISGLQSFASPHGFPSNTVISPWLRVRLHLPESINEQPSNKAHTLQLWSGFKAVRQNLRLRNCRCFALDIWSSLACARYSAAVGGEGFPPSPPNQPHPPPLLGWRGEWTRRPAVCLEGPASGFRPAVVGLVGLLQHRTRSGQPGCPDLRIDRMPLDPQSFDLENSPEVNLERIECSSGSPRSGGCVPRKAQPPHAFSRARLTLLSVFELITH
jgi:hypothetical protein